jgi:hypothetical protein
MLCQLPQTGVLRRFWKMEHIVADGRTEQTGNFRHLQADVTDPDQAESAAANFLQSFM